MNDKAGFKNPFASGLGRTGRMGAWVVAIGAVVAYNYYDSLQKTSDSFSREEQEAWNKSKKASQGDKK